MLYLCTLIRITSLDFKFMINQIIVQMKINMEQENKQNVGLVVQVYSPGNQIIQTQNNNYYGPVYQGKSETGNHGFTDEQIAKALMACVGEHKVIDCKWKWVGAYWYLRWACQYPVDVKDFCKKIDDMHLEVMKMYRCEYRNIREVATLSFISQDATKMNKVLPRKDDEKVFAYCREVAQKLAEELEKASLSEN